MGRILIMIIGALLVIAALAIHYAIKGLTLFPHASLVIGAVGIVVVALGVLLTLTRTAKVTGTKM